jgi:mxaJ protein
MSSACRSILIIVLLGGPLWSAEPLRVCADPNNMPFSNRAEQGFENAIASLVARDFGRPLAYHWAPQRRGFIRNTLNARRCDLVIGVPARYAPVATTRPYYRSAYAFVTRRDRHVRIASFDDARLRKMTIGVQVTGDDYANPPAAQALAVRDLAQNVRGYTVYGDYSQPDPQRALVDAVASRTVDVAVVWGPLAGYYARQQKTPLDVVPVSVDREGPGVVFAFDITMGVRKDDTALLRAVDEVIARRRAEITRILREYGVPLR